MELSPQMANARLVYAGDTMELSNGKHELSLIVKNLLDEEYKTGANTYRSTGAVTAQPGYESGLQSFN